MASRAASYLRISVCSTEALLLVFIKLCFDGLFFICLLYVYINEKDWDVDLDLLFMCQLVEMVDLWFFYQNIGFWKWGLFDFVIGIIFIFQVLVFITAEINGFLIFGNGVFCFCRWYRIYQVFFYKNIFIIKLLLRPMGSWMLAFIYQYTICVCVCVKAVLFMVWSVSCCARIVINIRPITTIDRLNLNQWVLIIEIFLLLLLLAHLYENHSWNFLYRLLYKKSCNFSHNHLYPHFNSFTDSSVPLILNGPHQGKSGACSNFFLYCLRSAICQLFIYLFPALGKN